MLQILIDAAVLIMMLKAISDEDVGLGKACAISFITAVGTMLLAFGLGAVLGGLLGVFLAALIAAVLLGLALSALLGAEIKRSMLVAGVFMLVHIGTTVAFQLLLTS